MKQKLIDMFHSTRFRLISSLLAISLFIGMISLIVGGNLLYSSVITETHQRVRQDLNVARLLYDERIESIRLVFEILSDSSEFQKAVEKGDSSYLDNQIKNVSDRIGLNFAGIVGKDSFLINKPSQSSHEKQLLAKANPLVELAVAEGRAISGSVILDAELLKSESLELYDQAVIASSLQAGGEAGGKTLITSGMTIGAAVPVKLHGDIIGIIYGGILLNRDTAFVDKVGETVFRNEVYKGRNVGTSTLFLHSLRIATNVLDENGERALGTSASTEVTTHVLERGKTWSDRALVLSDWYITAYEPIIDIFNNHIGMLYVGALEAKFLDIRKRAIFLFAGITLVGVMLSLVIGWYLTSKIMRPVNSLIQASVDISNGNLSPDIGRISNGDMGLLQREFHAMLVNLREREKRQKEESETALIQSEKHASVGKLAAGVAHEINNPLTAVLTFTHLILRRDDLADEVRDDLITIASQTERVRKIVKSLLDFSRQSRLSPKELDLNNHIENTMNLLQNQALIKGVELTFTGEKGLPLFSLDQNLCQSVWINMLINALDATQPGDKIEVSTNQTVHDGAVGAEIRIKDSGSGISPEIMDKLFDPFFTTKEVGKGTGLGLAVSAGIIERHNGTIKVKSTLGEGTCFTIWLPATQHLGDHCSYPTEFHRREV